MEVFPLKQGDLSPALEYQLQDNNDNGVNITGFNKLEFFMRKFGAHTNKVSADTSGGVGTIDEETGKVKYEWVDGDTDRAGFFKAEFRVTYSDGKPETFPNPPAEYIIVRITPNLG